MKLYLAADSSLELIRYLRSTNGEDGLTGKTTRKRMLGDAINSSRAVDELDETAQRWLGHVSRPIQAFVPGKSKGTSTKSLVTHVFGQPAPHGAFLDIGHGICICAPQFVLMGIAEKADLVETIRIGMELCGFYSQWRLRPDRMGDPYFREFSEEKSCTFELPPFMRAKKAQAFIERSAAIRGSKRALAALKWILDNSASPMETAVYLLLCLPKRLGGYGLPKPILNPQIIVDNPDGKKKRYPDLFWTQANIDVEYNSDADHRGEWSRYRDSKREIELVVASVKVLPLTRPQLMDAVEFDAFAKGLRRMLGLRARGDDPNWAFHRDELRRKLLAGWE